MTYKEVVDAYLRCRHYAEMAYSAVGVEHSWNDKVLSGYVETLFTRYAPFQIGDRVQLAKQWQTDNTESGWYGCQHFMTKGASATVVDIDCIKGAWRISVEFDNETFISYDGNVLPVTEKYVYVFGEGWFKKEKKK